VRIDHLAQPAVEVVTPRVVTTPDLAVETARALRQPGAAVDTGIVMCHHTAVGAHDEHRLVADHVLDVLARPSHFLLAARDLPHA
jgi:hypothetical protein